MWIHEVPPWTYPPQSGYGIPQVEPCKIHLYYFGKISYWTRNLIRLSAGYWQTADIACLSTESESNGGQPLPILAGKRLIQ